MPSTSPLWDGYGYGDASEDDLLALLDGADSAANDAADPTVSPDVAGGLAVAIAGHEEIKQRLDPDNIAPGCTTARGGGDPTRDVSQSQLRRKEGP